MGKHVMMRTTELYDRALDLGWSPFAALLCPPLFALFFAGVVGGSILQSMIMPNFGMGWLQQIGGIAATGIGIALVPRWRTLLALFAPRGPWLIRSVLVGLSITALSEVASVLIGDRPERHGLEYFAYQATMPGLSEELGFRGLVLGLLIAALLRRSSSLAGILAILAAASMPFAALHILEKSGFALAVLFAFTLYAGVVLGWLRLTTGSLLAAVLAHNLANVASGCLDNLLAVL